MAIGLGGLIVAAGTPSSARGVSRRGSRSSGGHGAGTLLLGLGAVFAAGSVAYCVLQILLWPFRAISRKRKLRAAMERRRAALTAEFVAPPEQDGLPRVH